MKKKIGIVILATIMVTLVACGNESKTGSNETSTVAIDNETENNTQENITEEKQESNNDELTDEYLLSLPETPVDEFWYEEVEGGIVIKSCLAKSDENGIIVIPNQIDGKDVIEIGYEAFTRRYYKAVVLNKNLKTIGGSCFLDAEIDKVLIQEGVEVIGGQAFYLGKYGEINIPSTVKSIKGSAFCSTNIKEIIIPKSVETISKAAFSGCEQLEIITFEGCPEVEFNAFVLSNNIKKVVCLDGNITFVKEHFITATGDIMDITFVAPTGSNVEQYAKDNGFKFEILN